MFPQLPVGWAVVVLIALTPAALRWWWGRSLAALADDPMLPERLAAHNRRFGIVSGGCGVVLVVGRPSWAIWSVPLLILAQSAGGFPLRKILYQETWSLAACLSFFGRMIAAALGFWILLGATPWLASRAGRADWVAGAGLALVLAVWNRYWGPVLRSLLRTRPITDPVLLTRFEALVSTCGLPMPRFEYVAMNGGVFANAVALASVRRSSVIFTDTLLSRLTEDETVAICAHELAHLEYFDRARLRRLNVVNHLLIAGAAAMAPVTRLLSGSPPGAWLWLWPVALTIALWLRARHRQQNETVSDLRAVALTGDVEALAGGLTKLNAIARLPRRWAQELERQSTHPSLARRIRDIRAAAGVAAATLAPSAGFRARTGAAVVTFDVACLRWQEGIGAIHGTDTTHVLDYSALVELRLHAAATGAITLVAVDREGRRWQMEPETGDLPAIQAVLDVVDCRLAHDTRAPAPPFSAAVTRLVACLGWGLAFLIGQFAFGFVAVLASISPAPALLNAAGASALAAAGLLLRDGLAGGDNTLGAAALFAVLGLAFLALGWARRGESARGAAPLLAVLGVCSVLAVLTIGLDGVSAIRLHQAARSAPAPVVLLVALAAACWTRRDRPAFRYAAFAAALAGGSFAGLGSTLFLDRVGRDLFLVAAPPATWTAIAGPPMVEFDVPFDVETLRLSSHARLVAIESVEDHNHGAKSPPPVFHVGRPGGTLSPLEAEDLVFVDDHRALLLVVRGGAAEVRDVTFDGVPVVTWRENLPDIRWGTLTYEDRSNQWTVLGRDSAGLLVRATGTVGQSGTARATWDTPSEPDTWLEGVGTRGGAVLIVEKRDTGSAAGRMQRSWIAPVAFLGATSARRARTYSESQLWRLHDGQRVDGGRSVLDTSCASRPLDDDRLVCAAFDGTRTRIVAIDIDSGSVTALMTIDGRFRADDVSTRGWLIGWADSTPVALRLATREAIKTPVPIEADVTVVGATDAVIGTVAWKDGGSRIRLYPLAR